MKRLFDIFFSLLALIILLPVFLIIAVVIVIDSGFPVFFLQDRVGKDNKLFRIVKFRTMKTGTRNSSTADLCESEECITKSGRFLRKTSIDELPQLLNILKGDMSFVGPRPLIPEEDKIRKLREEYGVYSVRPGMTGWAQINGRDNISDEKKALLDKEYVEKKSFFFDIKILFKTVAVVLKHDDVVEGGEK